jgi:hypothetical protein
MKIFDMLEMWSFIIFNLFKLFSYNGFTGISYTSIRWMNLYAFKIYQNNFQNTNVSNIFKCFLIFPKVLKKKTLTKSIHHSNIYIYIHIYMHIYMLFLKNSGFQINISFYSTKKFLFLNIFQHSHCNQEMVASWSEASRWMLLLTTIPCT